MVKLKKIILTALLIAALTVVAQPPALGKDQFVAVVITGNLPRYKEAHEAFVKILRTGGMGEDKVKVYVQTPNPDQMSWANSVRKAVGVGADLIITYGAPVTLVAKKEASGVPLLFADVYDPVALGVVKDLNITGGDISGVSSNTPVDTLIKTFSQVRPVKRIGVLYSSKEAGAALQCKRVEDLGGKFGYGVVKADVRSTGEIAAALQKFGSQVDGIYVAESVAITQGLKEVLAFSQTHSLPIISQIPGLADQGALLTLESDPVEQGQLLGVHAIQVLNGQKIFTLPVRSPKRISLVINLKTAERLGIKMSFEALSSATRVIK